MVKIEKVKMTEEDLLEKKLHLEHCNIQKIESSLQVEEMEELLEKKVPQRLLDEDIGRLEKDIASGMVKDSFGKDLKATGVDLDRMKITLGKFKKQKALDIPRKNIAFKLNQLREAKGRIDAPERQIKKLEKEIREGSYARVAKDVPNSIG